MQTNKEAHMFFVVFVPMLLLSRTIAGPSVSSPSVALPDTHIPVSRRLITIVTAADAFQVGWNTLEGHLGIDIGQDDASIPRIAWDTKAE